jgi:hypothetical protein
VKPYLLLQADARRIPLADSSVDLVFGSPPYCDARTYGIGAQRDCDEWVTWMLDAVAECQRVSRGPVVMVAAGVTRDRNYQPACEGLMWEWWKRGGECQLYRPCVFHRVGIPGSGGDDWFRSDWEFVMCFKRPGPLPWSDNTAMGHPPKWGPGGEMSNRLSDGARVNQWGPVGSKNGAMKSHQRAHGKVPFSKEKPSHATYNKWGHSLNTPTCAARLADGSRDKRFRPSHRTHTRSRADGSDEIQNHSVPVLANPGNVIKAIVGGGVMGPPEVHENEAPFPERLAEWFVKSCCPPGGIVLDPFSGSGTTASVAVQFDRLAIGADLRFSQCQLGQRRIGKAASPSTYRDLREHDAPLFAPIPAAQGQEEK